MLIPLDTKLETDRCILSEVEQADLEYVWEATRHPGFNDGMMWDPPVSKDEMVAWTEKTIGLWRNGEQYTFSIRLKDTKDFIGRIVLRSLKREGNVWYLGYWIHPRHWNKGFATEAAFAMLELGFSRLGAKRIESSHALWNKASAAVIKKLGMRFKDENPRGFQKRGEWVAEGEYYLEAEQYFTMANPSLNRARKNSAPVGVREKMKSVTLIHIVLVGLGLVIGLYAENKEPVTGVPPLMLLTALPISAASLALVLGSASLAMNHAWVAIRSGLRICALCLQ